MKHKIGDRLRYLKHGENEGHIQHTVVHGECLAELSRLPDSHIQLLVTSPPYAERRNFDYGGVKSDRYVDWFLPLADEMHRVLDDQGSLILNIKEHANDGQRDTYVYRLVLAMADRGWHWTDELIWYKPNPGSGRWPNRLIPAYERIYHFTKMKGFRFYPDAVKVPKAKSSKKRRDYAFNFVGKHKSKGGFTCNLSDDDYKHPPNVLVVSPTRKQTDHTAPFPHAIPEFFVKLLTKKGDLVCDPFAGSNTTGEVCAKLQRHYLGIELSPKYFDVQYEEFVGLVQQTMKKQFSRKLKPRGRKKGTD